MLRTATFVACAAIALAGAITSFILGIDSYMGNGSVPAALAFLCLGVFGCSTVIWLTFILANDMEALRQEIEELKED